MPILSEEDLERFRTKVCSLASSMRCDFGVERCNYSHNLYWARRCPFYLRDSSILRYIPACCPDVELGPGSAILKNTCPRGNNCAFAHSLEEMHYHPLVYKTQMCAQYREGNCRTYYCHMVHGLAEYRVPRDFVLPRKRGLIIPHFEHVTLVDNIRNFQGGASSCGYLRDKQYLKIDQDIRKSLLPTGFLHTSQPSPNNYNTAPGQLPCIFQVYSTDHGGHYGSPSVPRSHVPLYSGRPFPNTGSPPGIGVVRHMPSKESLLDPLSCDSVRSDSGEKLNTIRWTEDMVESGSGATSSKLNGSSRFALMFPEEQSNKINIKREAEEMLQRIGDYGGCMRVTSRMEESTNSMGDGTSPWFDRSVNAVISSAGGHTPKNTITNLDTMFQSSLEESKSVHSEAADVNSPTSSKSQLSNPFGCPNVIRNVSGWKGTSPFPRSLSLQCVSEEGGVNDDDSNKEINPSLLEYVYHTVSQQCDLIASKCVQTSNNRANLNSICSDAHNLWQLLVSIQTLLYEGEVGSSMETAGNYHRGRADTMERQWSDVDSFYCDLVDAYESENAKTTTIGSSVPDDSVQCSGNYQQ
ncbi:zinc CCCH type domain-containing protein [Babesia ovis]|uniref:Zinc CCCH type domain-containing protein n=1 Tax=Babesia ovis TaxID=5869 RepID=A0A9W5WUP6_BABOV|nr:zinc CCCH type domain-containing protein [Babesia ovis]